MNVKLQKLFDAIRSHRCNLYQQTRIAHAESVTCSV